MLGFCKPHFSAICVIDAPSVHCSSIPQKQPLKLWKKSLPTVRAAQNPVGFSLIRHGCRNVVRTS
jgi:hypothetical protein